MEKSRIEWIYSIVNTRILLFITCVLIACPAPIRMPYRHPREFGGENCELIVEIEEISLAHGALALPKCSRISLSHLVKIEEPTRSRTQASARLAFEEARPLAATRQRTACIRSRPKTAWATPTKLHIPSLQVVRPL